MKVIPFMVRPLLTTNEISQRCFCYNPDSFNRVQAMPAAKHLYRVAFINQGKVYEVYCRKVGQGGLFGFIEIEDMVFGTRTSVVVDPGEDKLKSEFEGVKRTYIPMHAVIRIDEVSKEGHAKIVDYAGGSNVTPFPVYTPPAKS